MVVLISANWSSLSKSSSLSLAVCEESSRSSYSILTFFMYSGIWNLDICTWLTNLEYLLFVVVLDCYSLLRCFGDLTVSMYFGLFEVSIVGFF